MDKLYRPNFEKSRRARPTVADIALQLEQTAGWSTYYTDEFYERILNAGFNRATLPQAFVLATIAEQLGPISVRGAMYRAVSAGVFPNTDHEHYRATCSILLKLRRTGCVRYSQIVDATRTRTRPSSWTGLREYWEVCRDAYRKDLWQRQPVCIEVFCEKLAMAGVLEPVTREFDIELNIFRGDSSESFVWSIGQAWNEIPKPIHVLYLGDHDPAGLRIEKTIEAKLRQFSSAQFTWERLAINTEDFADSKLIGFPVKRREHRTKWAGYLSQFGDRCVEVDAISPDVIRARLTKAIETRIDRGEWERLQVIEAQERETMQLFVQAQKVVAPGKVQELVQAQKVVAPGKVQELVQAQKVASA